MFTMQTTRAQEMTSMNEQHQDNAMFLSSTSSEQTCVTDTSAADRDNNPGPKEKHVSFGTVSIQKHQVIMGCNPYSEGFPLTLAWKHASPETVSVDGYEHPHHDGMEFKLDAVERQSRLKQMGYSEQDLRNQERKRKIRLTAEWAFGDYKDDQPVFGFRTTKHLMQRYVTR